LTTIFVPTIHQKQALTTAPAPRKRNGRVLTPAGGTGEADLTCSAFGPDEC